MKPVYVVTVCRNALADLKLTLASVRSQRYPALVHVIQDGASTDGTVEFLKDNASGVARWNSEADGGIYQAMNKAVLACADDAWLIFLNAGDRFIDDDVLQRLSALLEGDSDFIFGDVQIRNRDSVRIYPARRDARLEMPGCHQSTLVRAGLLKAHPFDVDYRVGADFEFYLRMTTAARRVAFFDGCIAEIAPEGYSASNEPLLRADYTRALKRHRGQAAASSWLLRRKLRAVALALRTLVRPAGSP